MDDGDREDGDGRRAVTTDNQTEQQRRQAKQADHIRELERLMRGAAAFTRKSGE